MTKFQSSSSYLFPGSLCLNCSAPLHLHDPVTTECPDKLPMPKAVTSTMNIRRMLGKGGAPTRATTLPTDGAERKKFPVGTGVIDYFPDAIVAVATVSYAGNEQHNPGQPLHWNRGKSSDEADTMIRHFLQRGTTDTDGIRHSAKMVWRALAILQKEIEAEQEKPNG